MTKEMLETLNTYWNQEFLSMWPLAYKFKEIYPDRWVRFHSLPDSKRYAENEAEYAIILERHNTVIDDLNVSQPAPLFLITTEWNDSATPNRSRSHLLELDPNRTFWRRLAMGELNEVWDESIYCNLYVSEWIWCKGVFDSIFKLAANDVLTNLMMVNMSGRWLYHPYDGGADVILASNEERDILKSKYVTWLSKHPLGY
jgi:hypothetical protein